MATGGNNNPIPLGPTDPFIKSESGDTDGRTTVTKSQFWSLEWLKSNYDKTDLIREFNWIPYSAGQGFPQVVDGDDQVYHATFVNINSFRNELNTYPYHWPDNAILYFYATLYRLIDSSGLGISPTAYGVYDMVSRGFPSKLFHFPTSFPFKEDLKTAQVDFFIHYQFMEIITSIFGLRWNNNEMMIFQWLSDLDFLNKIGRVLQSPSFSSLHQEERVSPGNLYELAELAIRTGVTIPNISTLRSADSNQIELYCKIFSSTIMDTASMMKYFSRWYHVAVDEMDKVDPPIISNKRADIHSYDYPDDEDILRDLLRQRGMRSFPINSIYLSCYDLTDDRYLVEYERLGSPNVYASNFASMSDTDAIMAARSRGLKINSIYNLGRYDVRLLLDIVMTHMNLIPTTILKRKKNSSSGLTIHQAMIVFSNGGLVLPHHLLNPSLYQDMTCLLSHQLVTTPINANFILNLSDSEWRIIISWVFRHLNEEDESDLKKLLISAMLTGYPSFNYITNKLLKYYNYLAIKINHIRIDDILSHCHCTSLIGLAHLILSKHPGGISDVTDYLNEVNSHAYISSYLDPYYLYLLKEMYLNNTNVEVVSKWFRRMGLLFEGSIELDKIIDDIDNNGRLYCQSLDQEIIRPDLFQLYASIVMVNATEKKVVIEYSLVSSFTNQYLASFILKYGDGDVKVDRATLINKVFTLFNQKFIPETF